MLARAAVVIGSCIPDDGVNRRISHLWIDSDRWWYYRLANAAACIAAAGGGCGALGRCIGFAVERTPALCGDIHCDGDRADACADDGLRYGLDCAKLGLHCDEKQLCSAAPSVSCDTTMFPMQCGDDGIPEYCAGGVLYHGAHCPELGLECSGKDCIGSGDACKTLHGLSFDLRWDGIECADAATLRACVGGRTAERSCADEGPGFTCQSFDGKFFCGLASECLPAQLPGASARGTPESCDGDTLVFCNAGRSERISCTELGFTRCEPKYGSCGPPYVGFIAPG